MQKPTQATQQMLLAMAEMNTPKELLTTLLEMGGSTLDKEHLHFLNGPVVLHKSQWMDIVPKWLIQAIIPERLSIIFAEQEQGKIGWNVGPAELTAVMMPASMDAPMQNETAEIYLWASSCAVAKRDNKSPQEVWHSINNYPFPEADIVKPSGRFFYDYQRIAGDIRRAVVRAQQKRTTSRKRTAKHKPTNTIQNFQPSLFEV